MWTDGWTDRRRQNYIPSTLWGDIKNCEGDMAVKVNKNHFDLVVIQPLEKGSQVNYKYMYLFSPFTA